MRDDEKMFIGGGGLHLAGKSLEIEVVVVGSTVGSYGSKRNLAGSSHSLLPHFPSFPLSDTSLTFPFFFIRQQPPLLSPPVGQPFFLSHLPSSHLSLMPLSSFLF
ncbi:hypothetical protein ACFX1Z_037330 [Malus domestica]